MDFTMFRLFESPFIGARKTKKYYQTFTYFVPSPPRRNTGYQEKELDKIIKKIITAGYFIENIQLVSNGNSTIGGFWIHLYLSTNDENKFSSGLDFLEKQSETIAGIEIIEDAE